MKEELGVLCVQCLQCKNIISRMMQHSHCCLTILRLQSGNSNKAGDNLGVDNIFLGLDYHLDAVGDWKDAWSGLTKQEFKELFQVCMSCDCYVMTNSMCNHHVCFL